MMKSNYIGDSTLPEFFSTDSKTDQYGIDSQGDSNLS